MNLIPYYLTKSPLSVSVRYRKGASDVSVDVSVRAVARVVGDCLVVEPVADVRTSLCDVCDKYFVGDDGLYRGEVCGHTQCGLGLGVLEALGVGPDPIGFQNYGWRVPGSPFSMFVKLNKRFKCQVYNLEGEEGDDWTVARVPLIRAGHARVLQTLMFLRSVGASGSSTPGDWWFEHQIRSPSHGVTLRCFKAHNVWYDTIARRELDEVTEILMRAHRVEVAS